jgi:beta-lactamase superfamily II metal-dependent hydrolase/fibronectin type 3 domain-containing protein/DNA/RNA endonuclease YhcR with UshA esterase domain
MNVLRRIALALAVVVLALPTLGGVVISQVYGGGGNTGSVYKNDFVELFNAGASTVSVAGWSVQYTSATGTTWQVTNLSGSIAPGHYYLVQEAVGAGGTTNLPTPDATGTIAMSATAGKVALVSNTTALSGACPTGATIVDFVGFGATANCFEGSGPTPAPSNSNAVLRAANGCTDTNSNSSDFSAAAAAPRNSASATNSCVTNAAPSITPPADPIIAVAENAAPFGVNLSGSDDNNVFNWSATPGTGVQSVSVSNGQGTSAVTYTVTLTSGFSGTASFTATLSDNVNTAVNQTVHINVIAPPAQPSGLAAAAGTSHVALTWSSVSGATTYNVKRATSSGAETTIASPATNSYDDTGVTNGTAYFYVVSAVGAGGEGADSSEVTATPLDAPAGVTATPGNLHVALAWNAVAGATGYSVQRSTTSGAETQIATPGTNSYDDTTVTNGTTYFYVIVATNANGTSIASSEVSATPATPGKIVISQVYGGGGNTGSVFKNDFIELFNSGGSPVSVSGWSVQYTSATGTTWQVTNLSGSIAPGRYYLVQEAVGAGGTTNLPAPDATGTIAMSATAGKVALVNTTTALSGACPTGAAILDFAGFGSTANCFEGSAPTPAPSNSNAVLRAANGCTDTDHNNTDFTAAAAAPRNSSTAANLCGAPPANNPPSINPPANPIATVAQDAAPFTVNLSGTDDGNVFNWSATPGTGVSNVSVSGGQGTGSVTYQVTLQAAYNGDATFTASLSDNVNPAVTQLVHITVTPPAPPAAPAGLNAGAGDSHVALTWNSVSGATSYNVKRSTTAGAETTIASPTTNSYDDLTAVNGTTYFYVVSAVGAGGEGANSSEVSATPAAVTPVPTGLIAAVSSGNVALSWNAVGSATSYNVKRAATPGGPFTTINSPTGTSYNDGAVTNGTRYYYVVSAVAPGTGESANSAPVQAKPDVPEALGVDISQVFGGGGNSGAVFTNDFIELFNRGNSAVDLSGWSVQYASSTSGTWTVTPLSGRILPGQHYLVQESQGAGGTTPLPTPDASGGITMSGTAGKVALAATTSALSGTCPSVVDFVGYGSGPNCFEGAGTTPAPSNTNSVFRAANGCTDTNNNAADFTAAAAAPRNTASAFTPCSLTAIGSVTPSSVTSGGSATFHVELPPPTAGGSVTADLSSVGGSASQAFFDDATNGDTTAGDNIFSFQTSVSGSAGVKSIPISATNAAAQTASTSVLLTITPPLETIAAVKVDTTPADTVPDRNGQPVLVRGVVTSIDFRGGAGIEYYIQDPTGGIDVFSATDVGPALSIGTNVEVSGTITQFNGLTELTPASITVLPGGTLPAVSPQVVTLSQLADGAGEALEGTLVRIDNLTVTSGTFPASGASGNVTIADATGSGTLRVDSDTDIDGTTAPAGVFSLVGVVSQSDTTAPFDCCYQVMPRSTADIIPRTAPTGSGAANPPSVPPGGSTLLTVTVTLGQNPASSGVTVVADLSSIGLSASQTLYDDGTHGDVSPNDQVFSFQATVDPSTALGPKSLPVQIADAQARGSASSIPLNIQSPNAPPTPTGLTATPGNQQVALSWGTSVGSTGYNVKRATVSGGPYTTIASNIAPTNYTDTGLANGTTYYYVVSALSGANESGNSSEVSAKPTAPPPANGLKVYFVDIGQGASTLIVSPSGKSLLVDGGPGGTATNELTTTLDAALGPSGKIDYTILTHYHIDHDAGLTDIINAGRLSPTAIAFDNGDGPFVVPPVPTNSTGTAYTAYKNALAAKGITRQTVVPGTTLDLGSGVRATFLAAGGNLASGGHVYVSGTDLNSTSVSTLIEYNNFDFLISGDLTGGGQTTTAKTPDVETFVAQMAGDVDFVQLDHHGSTTANGRRFLAQLKAEASLASAGAANTFGHPNRETANKYLNIPVTSGNTYGGEGLPTPGNGPVFYQTDPSPATDNRTTTQGYSGADQAHAGLGTILLRTDGLVSFSMESADDGGARISPSSHVYALDGQGNGLATDFPPTVIPYIAPTVPTAADTVTVTALVNDVQPITSVTLTYALNGAAQAPVTMTPTTGSEYAASIPPQPNGTRVDYTVTAVANGLTTSYSGGYFAGTTTIAALRSMSALGEPNYLDYAARINGLVTSGTGAYSSTNNDDYITDGTGALNISRTIDPSTPAATPTVTGNTYTVAGFINQLTGRLRLDVTPPFDGIDKPWATSPGSFNGYSIAQTGSGTVTPLTRTIAQILADGEGNEAQLVSVANCHVVSGTIPGSGGTDSFLTVSDGTGSIEMKIDGDSQIFGTATPAGTFTLVGIVQQDDFLRPFDTRYDIAPRTAADFGGTAGGPALITIADARADVDPTTGASPDDYVPDRLGQKVKIRGVVTSVDFRGASGTEVYIQDPTGGIDVFSTSINTTLNIGDNVEVTGTISQFNGLTEIGPASASDITILPPGTLPNPVMEVVTLSQIGNGGAGEAFEGKLIRINNVTLQTPPATFGANTNYNLLDATGTAQMRIDSDTDIDGTAPPAGTFSVIGVLGQFDNAAPFDSGYQLFPRIRATDFLPAVPPAAAINATAGTPQSAVLNTPFATALQATVTDGSANPIDGIGVTFTAPNSGASAIFSNGLNTITVPANASGVATVPVTANGAIGGYTVVASTGPLTANFSLTNVSNAATHFSVTAPATVTNGVAFNVTVTALTASNATATSYAGTVHVTSTSAGTLPGDYAFTAGDAGTHTFSVTLTTNGSQSITATDALDGTINGNAGTTVRSQTTHFSVTAPANPTSSIPFNVTVTALDASEATVTGYTGTAHFTSSDGAAALPGDYTFTAGDAGTHVFPVTLTATGAQSVTATDTVDGSITGTANVTVATCDLPTVPTISSTTNGTGTDNEACAQQALTLTASATGAAYYQWFKDTTLLTGETASTYQATGAATYYVTATNACGTTAQSTGFVVQDPTPHTAHITSGSTLLCAGAHILLQSDGATGIQWYKDNAPILHANSQSYSATEEGSYTAVLSGPGGCTSGVSNTIVLTSSASPAPSAAITAPAGVPFGTNGTASVPDAGPGATYAWAASAANIVSGSGTNSIQFTPSSHFGVMTVFVTVTLPGGCNDTQFVSVNVLPGLAAQFSLSAPSSAAPGTPFNLTLTAYDASNHVASTYTGTIHFTSSSAGTLPSDYTFTSGDNGAHTFSFALTGGGTQSITATDTTDSSITGTTTISILCTPPSAAITAPASVLVGSSANASVADAGAGATYQWSATNATIVTGSGTSAIQFTPTATSGTVTLAVTVTNASGCSDTKSATVAIGTPPAATHFSVTAPATVTAGTPFSVTVTALDASNNTVTSYAGTVHFTSSSAGTLPADSTLTSGTKTFSVTLTSSGAQSINVSDGSINGSANLTVSTGAATHFSVSAPATVTAGTPFNVTVTALDASNNTVTSYAGTVHFTSSSAGTLPADSTLTSGTKTFSVTLTSSGAQSITVSDGSISGSASLTVNAGAATHLSVSAPATVTAGTPFNVTVTALDASNNTVTSYAGTVHFTSSSAGTLPADSTLTSGTKTFSVTLTTSGAQSITVSDGSINGSASLTVSTGAATHFSVSAPATVTAGTPFNVTVTALDASNNTVTGYAGTVHFTSTSAGTLPADSTLTSGTKTFSVTLTTSGAQSINVSDGTISGSASLTVQCLSLSVAASNSGPVCAPNSVNLSASSPNNGVTFAWTGPNGFTSAQQNPTGITVAGTYTVTITGTGGCTAQSSTSVVINPLPNAAITAPAGACMKTTGNTASVAGGAATYVWTITNGTITAGAGTNSIAFTAGTTGSVGLSLTVTSGAGCTSSASASIPIYNAPSVQYAAHFSSCGPSTITIPFTLTGTAPWTVTWSDGLTQTGLTSKQSSRTFHATHSTSLWVTSVTDASCSAGASAKHITIDVDTPPAIVTAPVSVVVLKDQTATFTVVADGTNLHYHWYSGKVGDTKSEVGPDAPTFTTWQIRGTDEFWLRIENGCGSVDSEQFSASLAPPRRHAAPH